MNAQQKIEAALIGTRYDGWSVYNGYAADTTKDGWHMRQFGRSDSIYLGKSVKAALAMIDQTTDN